MEPLPICPACGADVQPHWQVCASCGYEPGLVVDAEVVPNLVDPFDDLRARSGDDVVDDPFERGPVTPDELLPVAPPQPGGSMPPGPPRPVYVTAPPVVPAAQLAAQKSPAFAVNRVAVVVASVIGVAILLGGIVVLTRPSTPTETRAAPATVPPATSKPFTGLAGVAESTTVPVPSTPPSTVGSSGGVANCDSRATVHSSNGKGTVPCGAGFSIDFPGRPEINTLRGDVAGVSVTWTKLTSTDPDMTRKNVIRYAVVFAELPADPTPEEAKAAMTAAAAQLGGTPTGDQGFQGYAGLGFKGRDELWTISGVAFVNGRKVVALAALGLDGLKGDELGTFGQALVWLP